MNSREIVARTLAWSSPARVAQSFEPSDFVWAFPELPHEDGAWRRDPEHGWRRRDEWGNVWGRADDTSKGQVVQGALEDLADAATCPLPDFAQAVHYEAARRTFAEQADKWHIGGIHGLTFSVARKLRRLEQYLQDLLLDRPRLQVLHDRIDEQIRWQIQRLYEAGADSIMFWEDWGTQERTLISPRLWRAEFKPRFQALIAHAHSLGLSVIMHSCGQISAIVPDLLACGVDVLQFDQPRLHGITTLAGYQETHHITFWCPVDIQTTLQTGDEIAIRAEAAELIAALWRGRGGFIAGYYPDEASIGVHPAWQRIACEEFAARGRQDHP